MSRITRWIQRKFGQRRPADQPTLNLPDDWLAIRIPYQQYLSRAQWRATRKSGRCQQPIIRSNRKSSRELSLEKQIGRLATLGQGQQETAIHIRRESVPTKRNGDDAYGEARNKRAVETINEILAVFPDDQIEISRVSDFAVDTESREADVTAQALGQAVETPNTDHQEKING